MRKAEPVAEWRKAGSNSDPGAFLLFLCLLLITVGVPLQAQEPTSEYVGSDMCGTCHVDQMTQLQKTSMAVLFTDKYPAEKQGCESCHGPGSAHIEAIGNAADDAAIEAAAALIYKFSLHSPKENAQRCLACHQSSEKHRLFERSRHLGAGVSCETCHDPHRVAPEKEVSKPVAAGSAIFSVPQRASEREWLNNSLLKDKQPQLCYSCHRETEAQFQLPVRHRVNEGLVQCSDCHNPHGSETAKELRSANAETCSACHVEKKGPFVYEHAPARVEGCIGCHVPHGTINAHLLKRMQERQLCLECHTAPEAVNTPHPRGGFQAAGECTRCHVDIHGSNYQRQYLR